VQNVEHLILIDNLYPSSFGLIPTLNTANKQNIQKWKTAVLRDKKPSCS